MKLNIKTSFRIDALILSKFAFLIFALYIFWFRYAYGIHQVIFYGSAILVAFFAVLDILLRKQFVFSKIPKVVKIYFALALYALITGVFVSPSKAKVVSAVITYFAYTVICFSVAYIAEIDGNFHWVSNVLIICGIITAAYIFFRGYSYETSGVFAITLGEEHNPNYLGSCMLVSIFVLCYNFERFQKHIVLNSLLLLAFIGVIIFSASRTSFIGLAILLLGWIIRYAAALRKKEFTKVSTGMGRFKKDSVAAMILLLGIGVGIFYLINRFENSAVYEKFVFSFTEGEGIDSRQQLFREAWNVFLQHPIFGVGLDQFREYSSTGMYSHSTYAEALSCLGLFGTLIFFIPILITYFQMLSQLVSRQRSSSTDFMLFLMFTVELVIGVGQIYFYSFHALLAFTMIFWVWEHEKRSSLPLTDEQEEVFNA